LQTETTQLKERGKTLPVKRSIFYFKSKPETGHLKLRACFVSILFIVLLFAQAGALNARPHVERTVLSNKLVLLVAEEHSLPFVSFQLLMDSGSRNDPIGKEGLARLTARGLLLGTSKRTAADINLEVDFVGASLMADANEDYATLNLRVLKKDLSKGFDLFMDVLTHPVFPADEVSKEVEKTLAGIQAEEDRPEAVADKAFCRELFCNAYGAPVEGLKESLSTISREDVERFYGKYYFPNNAILVVVGDITFQEVKERLLPNIELWKAGALEVVPFKGCFLEGPKTVKINRPITQANIIIGHAGVSRDNPDYYALTVMNYILGSGGFSSRLFDEIRVKKGLAYSVGSFFDPRRYPGSFQIILQTKNASAGEAIRIALDQMRNIRTEPVKPQEIEGAKKYLIGSFPMRFDTQGKLVNFLAQVEYYGLGLDYPLKYPSLISSVTIDRVRDAANRYLHPEQCLIVIVADLKESEIKETAR
jgi:zinc protease